MIEHLEYDCNLRQMRVPILIPCVFGDIKPLPFQFLVHGVRVLQVLKRVGGMLVIYGGLPWRCMSNGAVRWALPRA